MRRNEEINEVTPKECSEKSRNVPAVSGMSPRVRGMVPIIFGKWKNHFRKVVLVIGRFRKIPEGSGRFRGSKNNIMEG